MKINALWLTCAEFTGSGNTEGEHSYQDNCWSCAPYWWKLPTCPTHKRKLNTSGFCKECKKFYNIKKENNA